MTSSVEMWVEVELIPYTLNLNSIVVTIGHQHRQLQQTAKDTRQLPDILLDRHRQRKSVSICYVQHHLLTKGVRRLFPVHLGSI